MKTNEEVSETAWWEFPSLVLPTPERERSGLVALPVPVMYLS